MALAEEEIVVYKSLLSKTARHMNSTEVFKPVLQQQRENTIESDDDEGALIEELARRRVLANKKGVTETLQAKQVVLDAKAILESSEKLDLKSLQKGSIVGLKDDRLLD